MEILKNDNGISYTVLAKVQSGSKNRNNVFLLQSLKGEYIVALGWSKKYSCWSFGHYFMNDRKAAIKDFMAEAEKIAWYASAPVLKLDK